jgi:hypothetical protein
MIYPKTEFMVSASPLPITARPGVRFPPCDQVTTGKQLSLDEHPNLVGGGHPSLVSRAVPVAQPSMKSRHRSAPTSGLR